MSKRHRQLKRLRYLAKSPWLGYWDIVPYADLARMEQCKFCGEIVWDWVDPDWAHGRICRKCEAIYEPKDA